MGRKILIGENASIHPILSLSLLVACMAAIFALISSLCISRKKPPPPIDSEQKTAENLDAVTPPPKEPTTEATTEATILEPPSATVIEAEETTKDVAQPPQTEEPQAQLQLPLPPPPGLRVAASCNYRTTPTASENKLKSSMSTRAQGVAMAFRQQSKREEPQDKKRDKKLKHEDSIWQKTIILGEKCRVPAEDDAILYDEKGNRIPTFHTKTPGSLPVSRQTSFIDPDAIPSSEGQKLEKD